MANKSRRIGECWGVESSEDKSFQVFISPVLQRALKSAPRWSMNWSTRAVGIECKHRKPFTTAAKAIGLEGKITATVAGAALIERLKELIDELGEYPHARLVASKKPKTQSTRMLKVTCKECGCVVRMTRTWIDDAGLPTCGCGGKMVGGGRRG